MKVKRRKLKEDNKKVLMAFLAKTKSGKYAKISEQISDLERADVYREEPYFEEEEAYYYSTR